MSDPRLLNIHCLKQSRRFFKKGVDFNSSSFWGECFEHVNVFWTYYLKCHSAVMFSSGIWRKEVSLECLRYKLHLMDCPTKKLNSGSQCRQMLYCLSYTWSSFNGQSTIKLVLKTHTELTKCIQNLYVMFLWDCLFCITKNNHMDRFLISEYVIIKQNLGSPFILGIRTLICTLLLKNW